MGEETVAVWYLYHYGTRFAEGMTPAFYTTKAMLSAVGYRRRYDSRHAWTDHRGMGRDPRLRALLARSR